MLRITVCVGSSCYVRGSETLAETLSRLVLERGIAAQVELTGAFCMDQCSMGISVKIGDRAYRCIRPEEAVAFFDSEVVPCLKRPTQS